MFSQTCLFCVMVFIIKFLSDNLLAARDYYRWHDMAVRMVFL